MTSLPESIGNPPAFYFRLMLASGAILVTLYLIRGIAIRELETDSKLSRSETIEISLNPETGYPMIEDEGNICEEYALDFLNQNPKGKEYAKGILELKGSQESYRRDMEYIAPLAYYVVLRMLSEATKRLTETGNKTVIQIVDVLSPEYDLLSSLLEDYALHIPGNCSVRFEEHPEYPHSSFQLTIEWHRGFHGKVILEFNVEDLLTFGNEESSVISFLYSSGIFSPFRLSLGMGNAEGLIAWTFLLLEYIHIWLTSSEHRFIPRKKPWDFK